MVVLGAEVTSSLNPRATCMSCGRLCIENRNAVCVPRAVCRIWAKLRYPNGANSSRTTLNIGRFERRRCSSLSYRLPTTSCRFCNSIFPKARTGSVFLLTLRVTNRINSCSMTSSSDSNSSYGPVMTLYVMVNLVDFVDQEHARLALITQCPQERSFRKEVEGVQAIPYAAPVLAKVAGLCFQIEPLQRLVELADDLLFRHARVTLEALHDSVGSRRYGIGQFSLAAPRRTLYE